MTAAVLTGLHRIELQERPEPDARPGWVVITVESMSICGTGLHFATGLSSAPAASSYVLA